MERIDARRALELLTDVVDAYGPGYVYERLPMLPDTEGLWCQYQSNGNPSCIVGHVLYRAGATPEMLEGLDEAGISAGELHTLLEGVDPDAGLVLYSAQVVQDAGSSWSEALDAARNRYEKINAETEIED